MNKKFFRLVLIFSLFFQGPIFARTFPFPDLSAYDLTSKTSFSIHFFENDSLLLELSVQNEIILTEQMPLSVVKDSRSIDGYLIFDLNKGRYLIIKTSDHQTESQVKDSDKFILMLGGHHFVELKPKVESHL